MVPMEGGSSFVLSSFVVHARLEIWMDTSWTENGPTVVESSCTSPPVFVFWVVVVG